jgi:hypothetical protein
VTATKIGGHYVIDANEIEEASSVSSVVFAIDPEGEIIHIKKVGSGSLFINPLKENWKVSLWQNIFWFSFYLMSSFVQTALQRTCTDSSRRLIPSIAAAQEVIRL